MRGILTDRETGDLLIEGGTMVIGDTEEQTAGLVVAAMRGEFKEVPLLGGEAVRQLGGCADVMWAGDVKDMLRACGVAVERVEIRNGVVTIE